jgi:hypothetical protein
MCSSVTRILISRSTLKSSVVVLTSLNSVIEAAAELLILVSLSSPTSMTGERDASSSSWLLTSSQGKKGKDLLDLFSSGFFLLEEYIKKKSEDHVDHSEQSRR